MKDETFDFNPYPHLSSEERKKQKQQEILEYRKELIEDKITLSTTNFNTVINVCIDARDNRKMIGIVGNAGYGKTTALRHFYSENGNSFFVTVKPSMTPVQFYQSITEELGISSESNLHNCIKRIAKQLNSMAGAKPLLIIDEAGKFTPKMLQFLHELRDYTMDSTGIVLAGPDYFQKNLIEWVNRDKIGMTEIFTRINYWQSLSYPTKVEMAQICKAYGIEDTEKIQELQRKCKNFRDLHNEIMTFLYSQKPLLETV